MIQDYLNQLARELAFDRSLSRCVRQEVEDHLWEAVAASPADESLEAQRRAVAISAMRALSRRSSRWFRSPGTAEGPASPRCS